jgi:hypothetical protein
MAKMHFSLPIIRHTAGLEEAPKTGTPHIQGAFTLEAPQRLGSIKKMLPTAHLEPAYSRDPFTYCMKGNIIVDHDTKEPGKRSDKDIAYDAAADLKISYKEFVLTMRPSEAGRKTFLAARALMEPEECVKEVYWHWGTAGTGKTRAARDAAKEYGNQRLCVAVKPGSNVLDLDRYDDESTIIIDDLRPGMIEFNILLSMLDRYPYMHRCRYENKWLRATRFYITAPMPPKDVFPRETEETLKQLTRRITKVIHFGTLTESPEGEHL